MPKLDLIVTHYNEPMETGRKLFDMLAMQRGVNFEDFRIILVQDGEEGNLQWDSELDGYPYAVQTVVIPHKGVSAARNVGVNVSDAEWIMFVDFDDTFTGIHSIRRFMENMTDKADLIFCHLYGEQEKGDYYSLEEYVENDTFIHGKMFRRQFLIESGLRFDEEVSFSEDTLFCHVVNIVINHERVREIPEKLFTHCWYEGSVCRNFERNFNNAISVFRSRKSLIREYFKHGCMKNYTGLVIKTAFDYYYAINSGGYPNPEWFENDFWSFWLEYRDVFETADRELIMYENDLSFHEAVHKGFVAIPVVPFWTWVDKMIDKFAGNDKKSGTNDTLYPKIVVYHGTRKVYNDMYASLKSLVHHCNADKIYLLIEDDEYPYDVPENVEIINVKDQGYILPSSPNYECCWTYMVMLRSAMPKIFQQHDVILSLDTDTIINRNIDDLWNTDLTDAYFAAVPEVKSSELNKMLYMNMGVCLLNLKKLRDDGMDDEILNELNTVKYTFTEQDVFNIFCDGHKVTLHESYNASMYTALSDEEKIIHFAGFREKRFPQFERYRLEEWPESVTLKNGECASKLEGKELIKILQ